MYNYACMYIYIYIYTHDIYIYIIYIYIYIQIIYVYEGQAHARVQGRGVEHRHRGSQCCKLSVLFYVNVEINIRNTLQALLSFTGSSAAVSCQ